MRRFLAAFLSTVLCLTALSGCASVKTTLAYTVYPIGFLADRLGENVVSVQSIQSDAIVQRAVISKEYQDILRKSAAFLHIGQLEPYMSVYADQITQLQPEQIDLSVLNAVYDNQRYTSVTVGGQTTFIESPYYNGDVFNSIDENEQDLYLWLDPIAMLSMAKDIRGFLERTYPDAQKSFEANFKTLETDLINLDAQYQALATENTKNRQTVRFVSMSNSFGNWQKTYGFQVYPVVLSKYGVLPDKQQLALIEERIKEDGVKYIVYEPNMTADMIALFNQVENDLHLTRVELSNLSSLTAEQEKSGKDYLSIMYENLSVLQTMVEAQPDMTGTSSDAMEEEPNIDPSSVHKIGVQYEQ